MQSMDAMDEQEDEQISEDKSKEHKTLSYLKVLCIKNEVKPKSFKRTKKAFPYRQKVINNLLLHLEILSCIVKRI